MDSTNKAQNGFEEIKLNSVELSIEEEYDRFYKYLGISKIFCSYLSAIFFLLNESALATLIAMSYVNQQVFTFNNGKFDFNFFLPVAIIVQIWIWIGYYRIVKGIVLYNQKYLKLPMTQIGLSTFGFPIWFIFVSKFENFVFVVVVASFFFIETGFCYWLIITVYDNIKLDNTDYFAKFKAQIKHRKQAAAAKKAKQDQNLV